MKKTFLSNLFMVVSLVLIASGNSFAENKSKGITGTWHFKAPDAPYEYSEGNIIIEKFKDSYKFVIAFDEYNKLEAYDVEVKGKEISCKINTEGEVIYIKSTVNKDTMESVASYSEGTVSFTATKKKDKGKRP